MIGIYGIFRRSDDKCMYVGQSKDINGRIKHHLGGKSHLSFNKEEYYGDVIEQHFINDKAFRLVRETYWIEQLNPELNVIRDETKRGEYLKGENSGMYGKHPTAWNKGKRGIYSEETLNKLRKTHLCKYDGDKNPMYGKNSEDYMTPEAVQERRKKISEANKGTKFINNGVINKRVKNEELDKYIQDGWKLGRIK